MNVLIGIDDSPYAQAVLEFVKRMSWHSGRSCAIPRLMIRNAFRHAQTGTGRWAWTGLALLIFGCAHVPTQTGAMRRAGMEITADALHVQVVELGRRFSGTIETAADEILARAEIGRAS